MYLTIENLTVKYGAEVALQITGPLQIGEGDRIGIIGSNGAGKSTLIKSILGLVNYQGTIRTDLAPHQIATHMQFNEYTDAMPCRYVMEAILDTKISGNPKLRELISYFEFEDCLRKRYNKLSGGQKQRFTLIMVMMQDAPLTFYDEVTSGLDFETRQKLMEKLVNWYKGKTSGLCIVSHYYEELEQLADKILILDKGKVIDYGEKEQLFQKYCGRAVIVFEASPGNSTLVKGYRKLASPAHLTALSVRDQAEELAVTKLLLDNNINYRRSSNDIEIMYSNARNAYYGEECSHE
ncbi:MAG: ABC transporter ATP-binding protein [Butyrivibrio sp.]|nr:ABC transporter ATP-binding protein [Butyrivibrio sp.]